jgi:hypothetical protein
MLNRLAVAIEGTEHSKRRIAQDIRTVSRDHDRIAGLLAFLQPGKARFKAGRLVVPYRRRVNHSIVVNSQDTGRVCL